MTDVPIQPDGRPTGQRLAAASKPSRQFNTWAICWSLTLRNLCRRVQNHDIAPPRPPARARPPAEHTPHFTGSYCCSSTWTSLNESLWGFRGPTCRGENMSIHSIGRRKQFGPLKEEMCPSCDVSGKKLCDKHAA